MKLKKVNDAYIFECIAKDEKVAKDAGFFKHPVKGYLFTKDINTARKLFQYVDLTDTILYNELKINPPTVIKADTPEQIDYTKAVLVITYDFRKNVFVASIAYEYKDIAKDLGFKFSFDEYKQWETTDISIIQKIMETDSIYKKIITDDAHNQYEHLFKIRENKIRESLKKHSDIHVPKPEGLLKDYFPFQKAGIEFAEKRNYKCLIFDEPRCISGEAMLSINRCGITRKTSLKSLYQKFNGLLENKNHSWDLSKPTYLRAKKGDRFYLDKAKSVLFKGIQDTYTLTLEDGKSLRLTKDHELLLENGDWKELQYLKKGDSVTINGQNICKNCGSDKDVITYKNAKYPGYCKKCMYTLLRDQWTFEHKSYISKHDGYVYLIGKKYANYHRKKSSGVAEHIYVMEQYLGRKLIKGVEHVHHINHIRHDNRIENLKVVSYSEHAKEHSMENHFGNFIHKSGSEVITIPKYSKIKSIEYFGKEEVYDIVMEGDEHNFVANGIVVHNCGKTNQAIGCINKTLKEFYLIACPLSAMGIWRSFLKEWLIEDYDIKLVRDKFPKELKRKTIFIITYGMLYKYVQNILEIGLDFIIADEIHKVGKKKSRQGTAFYEIADKMDHNIYLSGTPFDNIYEAFYMLRSVGFSEAKNQYEYAKKYCNDGYGNWGKKFSSNMDELNTKLREEVMIRRLRSEVYPELPQKTRSIYRPSLDYAELFSIKEQQALEFGDIKDLKSEFGESIGESVKLEKYISTKKVKHTVEFAKALLEDTDKIIIFAHYIESQNEIFEHLKEFNPVMIQGGDSPNHRDLVCKTFDEDPKVRVAVLSLTGASDAVAFPAANGVIMHDTHWKPLYCMQAEDRPLGINHKEMLPIYYLVIEGTIDMYKTQVMVHKLDIIQKAIDTPDKFKNEDVDKILRTPISMKELIDSMVDED